MSLDPATVSEFRSIWDETNRLDRAGRLTVERIRSHVAQERALLGRHANLEPIVQLALDKGLVAVDGIGELLS